jgi:biopolymer transport protein ExbD
MSHGSSSGSGDGVEINLIPMIDIVIQLITFFLMLVNFDESNNDERVRLPIADLAKPSEMEVEEMLILNVNGNGEVNVGIGGDVVLDVDGDAFRQHMMKEARAAEKSMQLAKREIKNIAGRPQLWTTVMIRADRDVEYDRIQRMMKVCQDQGFTKFALRASPEPKKM